MAELMMGQALPDMASIEEQRETWNRVFLRQIRLLNAHGAHVHPSYLQGVAQLDFRATEIPSMAYLGKRIKLAGWEVAPVPGHLPLREYVALIAQRCFPVATAMRRLKEIDHASKPDMIHDIWGHLPSLFNPAFSDYLVAIASAIEASESQQVGGRLKERLSAIFAWSVEFGLLGSLGDHKIWGAGILSSAVEFMRVINRTVTVIPYTQDVETFELDCRGLQSQLFVAHDMKQYDQVLAHAAAPLNIKRIYHAVPYDFAYQPNRALQHRKFDCLKRASEHP